MAKRYKRENGCSHTAALEEVARQVGFRNYHEAVRTLPERLG